MIDDDAGEGRSDNGRSNDDVYSQKIMAGQRLRLARTTQHHALASPCRCAHSLSHPQDSHVTSGIFSVIGGT